jgi:hypothetical protein
MFNPNTKNTKLARPYLLLMAIGLLYLFFFFCSGQFRTDLIKGFLEKSSSMSFQTLADDFEAGQESGETQDDVPNDGKESKELIFYSIITSNILPHLSINKKHLLLKGRPLASVFFEKTVPPPKHT